MKRSNIMTIHTTEENRLLTSSQLIYLRKSQLIWALLLVSCFFVPSSGLLNSGLLAQPAHKALRQGDRAYEEQRFEEAQKSYQTALEAENSAKGNYNLGNALYEKGSFPEAAKRYEEAAGLAEDEQLRSNAYRNLGDAYFQQKDYEKSVEAYKNSLRIDPTDLETKYNLSKALKNIQQEQQQQNQQKQQQDQPKDQQKDQPQDSQDQQDQQNQQNPAQGQPGQSEQPPQDGQTQPDTPQDGQPSKANPGKVPKMSREEAERQLGIAAEAEKKTMTRLQRDQNSTCNSKEEW